MDDDNAQETTGYASSYLVPWAAEVWTLNLDRLLGEWTEKLDVEAAKRLAALRSTALRPSAPWHTGDSIWVALTGLPLPALLRRYTEARVLDGVYREVDDFASELRSTLLVRREHSAVRGVDDDIRIGRLQARAAWRAGEQNEATRTARWLSEAASSPLLADSPDIDDDIVPGLSIPSKWRGRMQDRAFTKHGITATMPAASRMQLPSSGTVRGLWRGRHG